MFFLAAPPGSAQNLASEACVGERLKIFPGRLYALSNRLQAIEIGEAAAHSCTAEAPVKCGFLVELRSLKLYHAVACKTARESTISA